jgi:4-hydroxy-tetrahydrodipicolinate synthase
MKMKLAGPMTALVTPFRQGKFDEKPFVAFVEDQIARGTSGLIPMGTTGENATVSSEEQLEVIRVCVKTAKGRVPVIAGTGKYATDATIAMTLAARERGADAALVVTPYYNKPTQEGLIRHFLAVADAVDIPIVLYNVPGRTGVNMTAETTVRLSAHPRIVATKEASGDLVACAEILRGADSDFSLISGEDSLTFPLIALGAAGVISVTSNVVPDLFARLVKASLAADYTAARELHMKLLPLMRGLFLESSPSPAKYLLKRLGRMEAEVRLPLVPVSPSTGERLDAIARELGILP